MVTTTDPAELPELTTYYLITNLPAPDTKRALYDELAPADLAEITRLYTLRNWIEQSYKQVKNSLGWAEYQIRKDLSIRRHWQLVCCAFSFCWWVWRTQERSEIGLPPMVTMVTFKEDTEHPSASTDGASGEKREARPGQCTPWPQTLRRVRSWLAPYVMLLRYWRAFTNQPPSGQLKALLDRLFSAEGLYLYAR